MATKKAKIVLDPSVVRVISLRAAVQAIRDLFVGKHGIHAVGQRADAVHVYTAVQPEEQVRLEIEAVAAPNRVDFLIQEPPEMWARYGANMAPKKKKSQGGSGGQRPAKRKRP